MTVSNREKVLSVLIGGRELGRVLRAMSQRRHYQALCRSLAVYVRPLDGLRRYLLGQGHYPVDFPILTPQGLIRPRLYSSHDMLTVNEIFCREDYQLPALAQPGRKVIVDLGSNIGLSALYFLTRSPSVFCYLYEPLPQNIARLKANLGGFEARYRLGEHAVGLSEGRVDFGFEASGRYGGIGLASGQRLEVACRALNALLSEILAVEDRIALLKIDTEALEKELIAALPAVLLNRIDAIFVEQRYSSNPFPERYDFEQYGPIARFTRI